MQRQTAAEEDFQNGTKVCALVHRLTAYCMSAQSTYIMQQSAWR